jgi:hypothetical protein
MNIILQRRTFWAATFVAAISTAIFAADAPRQPTYPVFGILQVDPQMRKQGAALPEAAYAALNQRQLIYTSDTAPLRAVRDARQAIGCRTPVIVYMGGFTTNPGGATEIETHFRTATAMIDVTTLAVDVDAQSQQLRVVVPRDGELAIQASTADRSAANDKSKYCCWIRIDDELLQVTGVDAKSGALRVVRGLESQPAPHQAGATVLTPVYLGNREHPNTVRESNSWPNARDYLRYALDPATAAAVRYKGDLIIDLMRSGYDGAWLDTFQPFPFNLCDALGRKITYFWDFHSGRRYDTQSYLAALQQFLRGVRAHVKAAVGREPYLVANSVSGSYGRGGKLLFSAPDRPGLLDAYCFEDSYATPNARRGQGQKLEATFAPLPEKTWLTRITDQADAARSGLHALCMIGPAGYVAAYLNPHLENYDQLVRFAWCSYLLTVTKDRTTTFGLPLLITNTGQGVSFLPLPEMCFAPLGDPQDNAGIDTLKVSGTPCYLRRFEHGAVVVNPAAAGEPAVVKLPRPMVDFVTHKPVESISLPPGDGCLLLDGKVIP